MSIDSIKAEMRERAGRMIASLVNETHGAEKAEQALRLTEETARAIDVGVAAAEHAQARKASSVGFAVDVQMAEGVVVHVTGCVAPIVAPPPPTTRMERPLPPPVVREVMGALEAASAVEILQAVEAVEGGAARDALSDKLARAHALLQAFA